MLSIHLTEKINLGGIQHQLSSCPFLDKPPTATTGVGLPPRRVTSFLQPIKENLSLKIMGAHSIPCECGKVYTEQTGHFIETTTSTSCFIMWKDRPWLSTD
jgi:hypothetical protein